MSRRVPISCKGCPSFGWWCRKYTATSRKQHKRFREKYCPCKTCLVKPMCKDPKVLTFSYDVYNTPAHRCRMMYDALLAFVERKTKI